MKINLSHTIYKSLLSFLLLMITFSLAKAESIGTWTLYPAYSEITEIQPTGKMVYVLASGNLFSYRLSDGTLETYTKNEPLTDYGISHIAWVPSIRRLVITYSNSNIDILDEKGNVSNISELYNKTMTEDKTINHIYVSGKFVYLSMRFGIVKINVATNEITDTYKIGKPIEYSYIEGNYLCAASKFYNILRCSFSDNMLDPSSWKYYKGWVASNENLLDVEETGSRRHWTTIEKEGHDGVFLTSYTIDGEGEKVYSTEGIRPEGPASNDCYHLEIAGDKVLVSPGLYEKLIDLYLPGNVYVMENGSWSSFQNNIVELTGLRYQDIDCTATDPFNSKHVFAGGKNGLFEFLDGKFVKAYRYGDEGVPLACALLTSSNPKNWGTVEQIMYDKHGNLWVFNNASENMICLTREGKWETFEHKSQLQDPYNWHYPSVISDNRGYIWFCSSFWENSRLFRYNPATDELKRYDQFINQDGTPYMLYLNCVSVDKNHNIWIGTDAGPFYISAEDILLNNEVFTQHKVPRNDGTNYADYLLSGVNINCITVDAANRKWVGTNDNGIYLISSDNNTQEYHFDTENSPLPTNNITDIKIDELTGRVYIATSGGLCSFMSDITENNLNMNEDNAYAYPNPVSPEYTGPITIVGLEPGSDVKILTTSGSLVAEGKVTGGSFQWNGCNNHGERVATGIYMVNVAREDGSSGIVTKIAVVR